MDHHTVAGWIINKYAEPSKRTLEFSLKDFSGLEVIKISYLSTYSNAGVADVYLCGSLVGTIDALSPSHRKVSIEEKFIHFITADEVHACNNKHESRTISLVYRDFDQNQAEERKEGKVKITGVTICKVEQPRKKAFE